MTNQEKFDASVSKLTDFLEVLKERYGLTNQEVHDILDIAQQDYA
jgi:hypothetical protein